MTEEKKNDLRHWLQRAQETLTEARTLKEAGLFIGTVNRLYYACFYAASALLETRGLTSLKHSGIISLLHQHFVKTAWFQMSTKNSIAICSTRAKAAIMIAIPLLLLKAPKRSSNQQPSLLIQYRG